MPPINKKGKRTIISKKTSKSKENRTKIISRLTNPDSFSFKHVFILKELEEYRLVVTDDMWKLQDLRYKTLRGARVAFTKFIRRTIPKGEITPLWSYFYPVDKGWLIDKLNKTHIKK